MEGTTATHTLPPVETMKQEQVISLIIGSEKGINRKEPARVGGISCDGITKQAYDVWRLKNKTRFPDAPVSVEGLVDRPEIVNAFYVDYFAKYHVWELSEFLQYIYADFVVNAGKAAVKIVQRMAGVDDDGVWGSGTSRDVAEWKASVESDLHNDPDIDNDLITQFHEEKLAHYQFLVTENPTQYAQWHPGWKRRANHVLSQLQNYFEVDAPTPSALHDDDILEDDNDTEEGGVDPVEDTDVNSPAGVLASFSDDELIAELSRRLSRVSSSEK